MTENLLIVLVGPPGSGKTTWARLNGCGAVHVSQDDLIDAITPHGFDHIYRPVYRAAEDAVARAALRAGHTVIVDRTNRTRRHRLRWLEIARETHTPAVAMVMTTPESICRQRNADRTDARRLSEERMDRMFAALEPVGPDEGFQNIYEDDSITMEQMILAYLYPEFPQVAQAVPPALGRRHRPPHLSHHKLRSTHHMSIATKRGDGGQTGLAGGIRVSKTHPRVDCYGTIDELISQMGFARSICQDAEIAERVKTIQRELYKVGSALATPPESKKAPPEITPAMVDALEAEVHRIEAEPGVIGDWSLPGGTPEAAALDVARTVCRRAERMAVGLMEAGEIQNPSILAYLNRLSDLLWLLGRQVEARRGVDSTLRTGDQPGPRWSRAW